MKIIVFSDSHGNRRNMEEAIRLQSDASLILFLGDGMREALELFDAHPEIPHFAVPGNCDVGYTASMPQESLIDWEGLRIFMCHGHTRGVKYGYDNAALAARSRNADLLLFGHTHTGETGWIPGDGIDKPLCYLNPGSSREGCYGLIQVVGGKPLCSAVTL